MTNTIDYKKLMHGAFQQVMVNALRHVAEHGLPGSHHFYITFDTGHAGVDMSDWLREKYPGEMTIVMHPQGFTHGQRMDDYYLVNVVCMPLASTVAVTCSC